MGRGEGKRVVDWRSTGRRRARRALFKARADFMCSDCGITTTGAPKDAPAWFDEIWPEANRLLDPHELQADHESKDLTNNDEEDLNWRCPSCHKKRDSQTEKGESTKKGPSYWG